jgi:cation:H+ antiporter
VVAIALVLLYAGYVRSHLRDERAGDLEDPEPLRLRRLSRTARREPDWPPHLWVVGLQVVVALACIFVGAVFFVEAVERVAAAFGIDGLLLALVIAPVATELPEKINSVLWVRQGKDNLALGTITGAMVFQAAIPPSIALVFVPQAWAIGEETLLAFLSAAIAAAARPGCRVYTREARQRGSPIRRDHAKEPPGCSPRSPPPRARPAPPPPPSTPRR